MSFRYRRAVVSAISIGAACVAVGGFAASPGAAVRTRATAGALTPPRHLTARRLRPRAGAVAPGAIVNSASLLTNRVFANDSDGFALADQGSAQYPARSVDGGRTWRVDGPQMHIDAADAPEAVNDVGVLSAHTFFAFGSSVVDVTTNGGRSWWETFLGEAVVAVVRGSKNELVTYVQQQIGSSATRAVTWQYVSRDGGRHWNYSTVLGG
jgi:hypothetical protein